jgi:hypothetical protein
VKGLYNENYKVLKKEIEENQRRWKDLPCSQIWQSQYGENGLITKNNPHAQCNPCQNSSDIHHKD